MELETITWKDAEDKIRQRIDEIISELKALDQQIKHLEVEQRGHERTLNLLNT